MHIDILRVAYAAAALLVAKISLIQSPVSLPSAVLTPEVDRYIDSILREWNSPGGIAVAVVRQNAKGDWDIATKGYGIAKADGSLVTRDTLFCIASNSKVRLSFLSHR